jgi:DNA/RNA-binding domain of Phe-tRNA-synthetase-like protein
MPNAHAVLTISPAVSKLGVRAAYLLVQDLRNVASHPEFEHYKATLCAELRRRYTEEFTKDDAILEGFRDLRKRIGRSSRRYPTSTESLIGFLRRKGTIPSISLAVDVYNCVSLETRLTLGAHDLARMKGNVHLRMVRGDERFVPLGAVKEEPTIPGEYGYFDDTNEMLCRLDYKQADKTKVTLDSTSYFYIIQGNPNTPPEYLDAAGARLIALLKEYGSAGAMFTFARAVTSEPPV